MDGTYNQSQPVQALVNAGHARHFCFDLSAATDRFPILIQDTILEVVIGSEKASVWFRLAARMLFRVPWRTDGDRLVYFSVGQPLGLHASWPILTLAHHI